MIATNHVERFRGVAGVWDKSHVGLPAAVISLVRSFATPITSFIEENGDAVVEGLGRSAERANSRGDHFCCAGLGSSG